MSRSTDILQGIKPGDVITASWLNEVKDAINRNTKAVAGPREVLQSAEELTTTSGGSSIGDETFTAGPADITSTVVTITDDGGNDHDIERIDTIVFTETTSGRQMTLQISYV